MNHVTTSDGVKLYVKDWGHGRPVVMAHGWPLSADTFDDLSLALADAGIRAISYDRRGFGRSDQRWTGYDYDSWQSFLKEFFGMGPTASPVSSEVVNWACSMAMQAGLKPTLACAPAFATTDFRPDLAPTRWRQNCVADRG